jgi:hypothetical protein
LRLFAAISIFILQLPGATYFNCGPGKSMVSKPQFFYETSQPLEASEKADEQQSDHYQEKSDK